MNYKELDIFLYSEQTLNTATEEEVFTHFKAKHEVIYNNDDYIFVFNQNREFKGKNHLIEIHKRNASKIPTHIYNYIVMMYIYIGSFTITVENETIILGKGDLIIFDRHVPYSVEKSSSNDLGVNIILNDTYFPRKFINSLPNDKLISKFLLELMNDKNKHNHYLLFQTNKDELTKNCIQNILCEYCEPDVCSDELIDNFIMVLITHLVRKFQYNTNLSIDMFRNQQLMDDILNYIHHHYVEGNLEKMCIEFGYVPSYTSKLIRRFSGKTFKQLVNDERMKKTSILLYNKNLPIYEIAEDVGIKNLTAFYKRFQEYAGCTPQEYRNRYK